MRNVVFILIISLSALTLFADWSIDQKVFSEEGAGEDFFGSTVSISGNYAVVGAPNEYPNGAAYLYKKEFENWIEVEKFQSSDSVNTFAFGSSVYINGNYLIVSANHSYNNSSGSAYIFYNNNDDWNEEAVLIASGTPICDEYGCSVGITEDGEYAIVGARNDDENGEGAGAAYLYKREDSQWNQQIKLMASDGNSLGWFGNSVYVKDDYIYISSSGIDSSGSIYIYQSIGDNWEYYTTLTSSYSSPDLSFGSPISISGDYLITGSHTNYYGTVFTFHNNGSGWVEQEPIIPSDSFEYDHFGRSVSISGNFIVVGACDCPDVGMSASAYFFEKEGSNWVELNKLTIENWGAFGYSVSISGENAIVGANLDWGVSNATGAAYLISNDETSIDQELIICSVENEITNFPNPFNPATTIKFSIKNESEVELSIFNIKGQLIKTLINEPLNIGEYSVIWNGKDNYEKSISSGVYFYQIKTPTGTISKRMLLLK